jgi:hypothetical protein
MASKMYFFLFYQFNFIAIFVVSNDNVLRNDGSIFISFQQACITYTWLDWCI